MTDEEANSIRTDNRSRRAPNRKAVIIQYSIALVVGLLAWSSGIILEWSTVMWKLIEIDVQTSDNDFKKELLIFLDLLPQIVAAICSLPFGLIAHKFGRKKGLYLAALFGAVSGFVLIYAENWKWMLFGRALSGVCLTGAIVIGPAFLYETVHCASRSIIVTMYIVEGFGGMLVTYLFGQYLLSNDYKISIHMFLVVVPSLFIFLFFWLPETPHFLVMNRKTAQAEKSLYVTRGRDPELVREEMEEIVSCCAKASGLNQVLKSNGARRGLTIGIALFIVRAIGGIYVIRCLVFKVFQAKASAISIEDSAILQSSLLIISSILGSLSADRAGRKLLLYISYGGSSLSFLIIGLYELFEIEAISILPKICLSTYMVCFGWGYGTISALIALEVSTIQTRFLMTSLACTVESMLAVCVVVLFTYVSPYISCSVDYFIPAVGNMAGLLFAWLVIPETAESCTKDVQEVLES